MKLVIDISEGMLDELRTCKFPIQDAYRLCTVIENGTPLPKGHGRLIDADELAKRMSEYGWHHPDSTIHEFVEDDLPTIIEADKEYDVKAITRGNCMACGKELTEGVFFCKECEEKGRKEGEER